MFLHPRKSQIDVVQAVGRVMRQAKDKRMGYVILPVGVPAGVEPVEARTRRTGSPAAHRKRRLVATFRAWPAALRVGLSLDGCGDGRGVVRGP